MKESSDTDTILRYKPEKIRPGEISYFIPNDETPIAPNILEALNNNRRNYAVSIRSTPNKRLHLTAAIIIPCLSDPKQSQIRVVRFRPDENSPEKLVRALFRTDFKIFSPPESKVCQIRRPEIANPSLGESYSTTGLIDDEPHNTFASAIPFIGNEDPDDPDEDAENDIEEEQEKLLERIIDLAHEYAVRFHKLPSMKTVAEAVAGRMFLGDGSDYLAPITVTRDLKIYLNIFDVELRMPPIIKSLYFLFLRHPRGIVLKEISNHREELLQIYALVKKHPSPTAEDKAHIDRLIDPLDNSSLNQKISKCRILIDAHILNPETAWHYYIEGNRGEPYRIHIDDDNVNLPFQLLTL